MKGKRAERALKTVAAVVVVDKISQQQTHNNNGGKAEYFHTDNKKSRKAETLRPFSTERERPQTRNNELLRAAFAVQSYDKVLSVQPKTKKLFFARRKIGVLSGWKNRE